MKIFTFLLTFLFYAFLIGCFISSMILLVAGLTTTPEEIITEKGMDSVTNISEAEISEEGFMVSGFYYIEELEVLECYAKVTSTEELDADGFGHTIFHINEPYGHTIDEHYIVRFYDSEGNAYVTSMTVERYDVANKLFDIEGKEFPIKMQAYVECGGTYEPVYQGKVSVYEYRDKSIEKYVSEESALEVVGSLEFYAVDESAFVSESEGFADVDYIMNFVCSAFFLIPDIIFVVSLIKKLRKRRKAAKQPVG